MLALICTYIK